MCRCNYCGRTFDNASYRQEIDGFYENDREIVTQTFYCPYCGDTDLEWYDEFDDEFEPDPILDKMVEERREREELLNEWY